MTDWGDVIYGILYRSGGQVGMWGGYSFFTRRFHPQAQGVWYGVATTPPAEGCGHVVV